MSRWVFVESNTTGSGALAISLLRARGEDVTFVTRDRSRYPFLDGIAVVDTETNDAASLIAYVTALAPDAVVTFSTFYVETVARLAATLGLRFLSPHAAATCHNKLAARRALGDAGLTNPRFWELASADEVERVAAALPYPCVMKPTADSGSSGVLRIDSVAQLIEHYRRLTASAVNDRGQTHSATVLVEELLDGPEFSVESVTLARGVTRIVGITRKHLSPLPYFVEMGHDYPAALTDEERLSIEACVLRALDAVGFDFGPAHTELRLTHRGPVIVEINPRLAGGMIPELVRLATGIDLIDAYLRLLVGDDTELPTATTRTASIRFLTAPMEGRLGAIPACDDLRAQPGVDAISITASAGRSVRPPQSAYDRLGYVICNSPERADVVVADVVGRLPFN